MVKLFLDSFSKSFSKPNNGQCQSIAQIVTSFQINGDRDFRKLAYILATALHESKLLTIKEIRGTVGSDLYNLQEKYWNTGFYGRGYVQLTHKDNYIKMGKRLNIDLVSNPDLALNKIYASDILVIGMIEGIFTGRSLKDYINSKDGDYFSARKIVNGLDRAQLIADNTVKLINNLEYQIA